MLTLQAPAVQTALARYVSERLDGVFNGKLEIGSVQIHPFNAITIRDAVLIDPEPYTADARGTGLSPVDTVASIGKLSATLSVRGLFNKRGISLGRVQAEGLLFQLAIEPDNDFGTNLTRVLNLVSDGNDSGVSLDSIFFIHKLKVTDARFRMLNFCYKSSYEHGMNWGDLDVRFDVTGHNIGFYGGRMHGVMDHMRASEKSGFEVLDLSGGCKVGLGKTILKNVHLRDASGSDILIPEAVLSYENTKSWSDFVHKVNMDIDFSPSTLVLESISHFSGGTFRGCKFTTGLNSGHFSGTVSDFYAEQMVLDTPYGPSAKVNVHMFGLPSIQKTSLEAAIENLTFTAAGLEASLADLGSGARLSRFAPGVTFTLHGNASGPMNKLSASARLRSNIGRLDAKGTLLNTVDRQKPIRFDADATAHEFNLGKFLVTESLGPASFSASAKGTLGSGNMSLLLEGLDVSSLNALGYEYKGLHLAGSIENKTIAAALLSEDPNALLNLEGSFDMDGKSGSLNAEFSNVDLAAINLDKRGGASRLSCSLSADQGIQDSAPIHFYIEDFQLTNDRGLHRIGDIESEARLEAERLTAIISSDFMDAKYNGPSNVGGLISYVRNVTLDRDMPAYFAGTSKLTPLPEDARNATVSAIFKDTRGILDFVMPGMVIADGTTVNMDIDNDGMFLGYVAAPRLAFNTINSSNLVLSLSNQDDALNCTVNSDKLTLKTLSFDNASINFDADENLAKLGVRYAGANLLDNGSELNLQALLLKDDDGHPSVDISTLPSYLSIKNDVWRLSKSSIGLHNGEIGIDGFRLASDRQSIVLDGGISHSRKDTLQVSLKNVDLEIVNEFLSEKYPQINGVIDGDVTMLSPVPSEIGLWADLSMNGIEIDDRKAGDFRLYSDWNDAERLISLRLDNTRGENKLLSLNGTYGLTDRKVNATATLNRFNAGVAAPFLKDFLTELDGDISGDVAISGPINSLSINSEGIQLDSVRTRISYTNVAYTLDGVMSIDGNGLKFKNIAVSDDYGGKGTLGGGIAFHELRDFNMDATLMMRRLKAIDIPDQDSPIMVYGDLALTGRSRITGPFNSLYVDADVATSGAGNVNVPVMSSSTAHGSDLLTFVQPDTDGDEEYTANPGKAQKSSSKFAAHAKVNVSPEVIAQVEIDKESGHVLTAGGNGAVVVDINTGKGKLQLNGDYKIDKGKYLFNIPGVVSKEFDIQDGSSLQFNGDVMESTLDINALHTVKTSLATIVADTTSVSSRRLVECGINITGKLSNPEVSFSINVPDLDPSTKMQVEGALNTQDKVQKQFVALLLFGTFLPEEGSGVINGTNMIASNVGEIVSSQLNNILQKLDIPLDFGLGYQQDNMGTDLFDVAVSTQLFNNRVLVNGSVGNRRYSTSKSAAGDVVGDLDIEIKMDKSGELRFKLFSHSADEYSSSLDFSQRNGLGLSYQKEFDRTRDFFRQIFMSRKRKQEENMREMLRKREMTTITIE